MKKILVSFVILALMAISAFANSGSAIMPYGWTSAGAYKASAVVFCAFYADSAGETATTSLEWCGTICPAPQTWNPTGPAHQRFDTPTEFGGSFLGYIKVDWTSSATGYVGCTGVEWYGTSGSLYHVPFVAN